MPRLIDADALIAEWCDGCKYLINGMCDQDICGGVELIKDAPTIDPESIGPTWAGEKGYSPDDPPGPYFLEADKAVPVEKLGKLGKLMLPYEGCPRGQMGRMGDATLEEEALDMGVIADEDGGRWIPVNEAVLRELIEKAKDRPHGRWRRSGMLIECCYCGEIYSLSGGNDDKDWNACPSCTALMDFKQATCGDCLYVELCETDHSLTEFSRDNPAYCKKFHPKLQREDG